MSIDVRDIRALEDRLQHCMLSDRHLLRRRLRGLTNVRTAGENALRAVAADVDRAVKRAEERRTKLPKPTYPPELHVDARKDEIAKLVYSNKVVVVLF
jgi:ATP-dependent helicase HrpA